MSFDSIPNNLKLAVGASKTLMTPIQVGQMNVLPITTSDSSNTPVACYLEGIFNLSVTAVDDMGNAAVAIGDILYLNSAVLNVDSVTGGTRFGVAVEAVTSGATATIRVLLSQN